MYLLKDNRKIPIEAAGDSVVEGFNWKDSHTWLIIGGIALSVIFIILLIIAISQSKKESYRPKKRSFY